MNRLKSRLDQKNETAVLIFVLLGWFVYICVTSAQHVIWRDEMRALSIANAGAFWDLPKLLENEGHPVLWYFLLNISFKLYANTVILKILSVLIALGSMSLFFFYSPFKYWQKILFAFSFFPLLEYSVLTRNYGISMLLLFSYAALYSSRKGNYFSLAIIVALLANTNLHCFVLAAILMSVWVWDDIFSNLKKFKFKENYNLIFALLVAVAGLSFSLYVFYPNSETNVVSAKLPELSNMGFLLMESFLGLGNRFSAIFPLVPIWASIILIWIFFAALLVRPIYAFAFLGAALFFQLFFTIYYWGFPRHQGLLFMFWISLCWMVLDKDLVHQQNGSHHHVGLYLKRLFNITLVYIFPFVLALQVIQGLNSSAIEHKFVKSSSKDFGRFLEMQTEYDDAILIGEPDYNLESMPYYANNSIYIPRERVFKDYVSFTKNSEKKLSLEELLETGLMLKNQEHKPVLIVLGHLNLDQNSKQLIQFGYGSQFTWDQSQLEMFYLSTKKVASFYRGMSSERYDVFEVL